MKCNLVSTENKLFAFDGEQIQFYKNNVAGELSLANDQFEDLTIGQLHCPLSEKCSAGEHANVGDLAFQIFFESLPKDHRDLIETKLKAFGLAEFRKVSLSDRDQLYVDLKLGKSTIRAGMMVTLGGYYGYPDRPIAYDIESMLGAALSVNALEKRFEDAFQTLQIACPQEVSSIVEQIGWEGNTIHGLIKRKAKASIVMGAVKEGKITWASGASRSLGWTKHIPGGFFINRYLQAATMNLDHFGTEAERAYEQGHRLALQMASRASLLPDDDENKWKEFSKALSMELFAGHFFADLFVSGHVRTIRKKVFEVVNENSMVKKKWIAALFTNLMHDEDNEKGVYVCSENHPLPWAAMGDYRYSDDASHEEGEKYVHRSLAARLTELVQVFFKQVCSEKIALEFKKDIPREVTPAWLVHCHTPDSIEKDRALEHAQQHPPFLRIGEEDTLQVRPAYQSIDKAGIMQLLAKTLSEGVVGQPKPIDSNKVKEIGRIRPAGVSHGDVFPGGLLKEKISQVSETSLQAQILEELYLMDEADEVILAIEMP
jgi:hypothetical protein